MRITGGQLFLFLLCITVAVGQDYFWRDFDGTIPEDAFVAAEDDSGKSYIGNTYVHPVGLLIGQLFEGSTNITLTGGVEFLEAVYERDENIQILCSDHPEKLQWIWTNRTELPRLTNYNFVVGGQQAEQEGRLYIGRIDFQGMKIGKVDSYFTVLNDLYFPLDGVEYSTIRYNRPYEVLIYDDGNFRTGNNGQKRRVVPPAAKFHNSYS